MKLLAMAILSLSSLSASGIYWMKSTAFVDTPKASLNAVSEGAQITHTRVLPVFHATDSIGGYIGRDRTEILDLVWGIDFEGDLGIAVFKGKKQDGTIVEYSRPEDYARLAFSTDELTDFHMYNEEGQRMLVSSVEFCLFADGALGVNAMTGTLPTGVSFAFMRNPFSCCGPRTEEECVPTLLNPCNGICPGPANCACQGTSGTCKKIFAAYCGGECDAGCGGGTNYTCVGPYPNCHCQAPPP